MSSSMEILGEGGPVTRDLSHLGREGWEEVWPAPVSRPTGSESGGGQIDRLGGEGEVGRK